MRFHDYLIFFMIVLMCLFVVFSFRSDITAEANHTSVLYKEYLEAACEAGIEEAIKINNYQGGKLFNEKSVEAATDSIYRTLELNFGMRLGTEENDFALTVPLICFIDKDGYYIMHSQLYKDARGYTQLDAKLTNLYTWTVTSEDGSWTCRFNLDDTVTLIDIYNNRIIQDTYNEAYRKAGSPYGLSFLANYDSYIKEKNATIKFSLERDIAEFINNYNYAMKTYDKTYDVSIEAIFGTDWANAVENPTILAFMQGPDINVSTATIDVFTLTGTTIDEEVSYYICMGSDGYPYYHEEGCSQITGLTENYNSIELCAKKGAFPCLECKP